MSNVTQPKDNFTLAYRTSFLFGTLSVKPLFIFLYINGVLLFTLTNKPVFRETPRYVLLYNLLFADTFQLVVGHILYILATARVYMIRYLCVITVILAMLTTEISPYNLAVMSLERYVAVCFPLRHSAIVTIKNTVVAKSASSNKTSPTKAHNTLVLHMIQLLLILSSTLVSPIVTAFSDKVDRPTLERV
ncbi:odorant receptor 131-2-like [Hypomesus transpacificus]|uniref:odorant receptor 131-2-like n=1 Tax=Hypomesus transpacificus TaxID=137520 RepID=UPI001F082A32|nr:odorant receptor 131-2-like [Hypomesus transpacificus]